MKVLRDRGQLVESDPAPYATVTVHPSALLRFYDPGERRLARAELERDPAGAWERLEALCR